MRLPPYRTRAERERRERLSFAVAALLAAVMGALVLVSLILHLYTY